MESKILCLDKFVLRVNTLIRLRTGKKSAGKETILFITKFPPIGWSCYFGILACIYVS